MSGSAAHARTHRRTSICTHARAALCSLCCAAQTCLTRVAFPILQQCRARRSVLLPSEHVHVVCVCVCVCVKRTPQRALISSVSAFRFLRGAAAHALFCANACCLHRSLAHTHVSLRCYLPRSCAAQVLALRSQRRQHGAIDKDDPRTLSLEPRPPCEAPSPSAAAAHKPR